jgi:hypothetical protein
MDGNEMNQLDDLLNGADSGTDPEPPADNEGGDDPKPNTEPNQGTDPNNKEKDPEPTPPQLSEDEKRRNEAFARLRAENSQHKKLLDRVAQKYGADGIDQLQEKLDQEALDAEAKELKMSPEAIKRMKALEEQNRQITERSRQQQIISKIDQVQKTFDLDQNQLKGFVEKLRDNRIDILNTGVPIDTLYRAFNYDDMVKTEIEKAKEKWIEQTNKANNSSGTMRNKGKGNSSNHKVNTMKELDDLLKNI